MFPEDTVRDLCRHMNDDHAEDALRIVRELGGLPDTERVETVGVDADAIHFIADVGETRTSVTVPFTRRVTATTHLRPAVIDLSERARSHRCDPQR